MNFQIMNNSWIEVEEEDYSTITAYGTDGNIVEICNINKRYLKQLHKDLGKLLKI